MAPELKEKKGWKMDFALAQELFEECEQMKEAGNIISAKKAADGVYELLHEHCETAPLEVGLLADSALKISTYCDLNEGNCESALLKNRKSENILKCLELRGLCIPVHRMIEVYSDIASCHQKLGQVEDAVENGKKALEYGLNVKDDDKESLSELRFTNYIMLYAYIQIDDTEKADEYYKQIIKIDYRLKEQADQEKAYYIAEDLCEYAGFCFRNLEDSQRAKDLITKAFSEAENILRDQSANKLNAAMLYNKIGILFFELGMRQNELDSYMSAIDLIEKIKPIPVTNNIAAIYSNRAETRAALGEFEESEKDYAKAKKIHLKYERKQWIYPRSTEYFNLIFNMILTFFDNKMKNPDYILRISRKYLNILSFQAYSHEKYNSLKAKFLMLRARAFALKGKKNEELREYSKAIYIYTNNCENSEMGIIGAYTQRAHAFERAGMPENAARDFINVSNISGKLEDEDTGMSKLTSQMLINAAIAYDHANDFENGKRYYSKVIERIENSGQWQKDRENLDNLAFSYYRRGTDWTRVKSHNYTKAVRDYERSSFLLENSEYASSEFPKLEEVYQARAEILEVFGERESAKELFEKAIQIRKKTSEIQD